MLSPGQGAGARKWFVIEKSLAGYFPFDKAVAKARVATEKFSLESVPEFRDRILRVGRKLDVSDTPKLLLGVPRAEDVALMFGNVESERENASPRIVDLPKPALIIGHGESGTTQSMAEWDIYRGVISAQEPKLHEVSGALGHFYVVVFPTVNIVRREQSVEVILDHYRAFAVDGFDYDDDPLGVWGAEEGFFFYRTVKFKIGEKLGRDWSDPDLKNTRVTLSDADFKEFRRDFKPAYNRVAAGSDWELLCEDFGVATEAIPLPGISKKFSIDLPAERAPR